MMSSAIRAGVRNRTYAFCSPSVPSARTPSASSALAVEGARRSMSKYLSKSARKRLPLTTKRAKKGYYKGNGATKEGHFGKGGKFIVDRSLRLELVAPDLTGFKLKHYIASTVPKYPPEAKRDTGTPSV